MNAQMDDIDPEIVSEFIAETREHLENLETQLLQLESSPEDEDLVGEIFREVHSVKGASAYFNLDRIESVSHAAEDLMSRLRDKSVGSNEAIINMLLKANDMLRKILETYAETRTEGDFDCKALVSDLRRAAKGGLPQAAPEVPGESETEAPPEAEQEPEQASAGVEKIIRVSEARLDELMNLIGELSIRRNQFLTISRTISRDLPQSKTADSLEAASEGLNRISEELQETIMQIRLVPVSTVFNKFPRLVRDFAQESGKKIDLNLFGGAIEVDKTVIETLKDPLIHLIRNAVDHGIESVALRRERKKPETGTVELRARRMGGNVIIEIKDDGAGMDLEKIKSKAVQRGLHTRAEVQAMGEAEVLDLIFTPGFSMAEKVTGVSGRGVGMDVVRTNIRKLNGSVSISTRLGEGTRITIRHPLTMAIVKCMLVQQGPDLYAVPVSSIETIERFEESAVYQMGGGRAALLQGESLGIARLCDLLGLTGSMVDTTGSPVVVLTALGNKLGLVVDGVHEIQELVIKPMEAMLSREKAVSGSAILGDGRVALILDPIELLKMSAGRNSQGQQPARIEV